MLDRLEELFAPRAPGPGYSVENAPGRTVRYYDVSVVTNGKVVALVGLELETAIAERGRVRGGVDGKGGTVCQHKFMSALMEKSYSVHYDCLVGQ